MEIHYIARDRRYYGTAGVHIQHYVFLFQRSDLQAEIWYSHGSPVSPLVANMFMEHLEGKLHATAPKELKLKVWNYGKDMLMIFYRWWGKVQWKNLQNLLINCMSLAVSSLHMRWNKMASYLFDLLLVKLIPVGWNNKLTENLLIQISSEFQLSPSYPT